jgi:hypothetical protein
MMPDSTETKIELLIEKNLGQRGPDQQVDVGFDAKWSITT